MVALIRPQKFSCTPYHKMQEGSVDRMDEHGQIVPRNYFQLRNIGLIVVYRMCHLGRSRRDLPYPLA